MPIKEKQIEDVVNDVINSFFNGIRNRIAKFNPKSLRPLSNPLDDYKAVPDEVGNISFKAYLDSLKNPQDLFSGKFKKLDNGTPEGEYLFWSYSKYKEASDDFFRNKKRMSPEEFVEASTKCRSHLDLFVREMYKTFNPEVKDYYKEKFFISEFEKFFPNGTKLKSPKSFKDTLGLKNEDISISIDPISLDCKAGINGKNAFFSEKISAEDFTLYSKGLLSSLSLIEKYFHKQIKNSLITEKFQPYLKSLKDKSDLLSGDMNKLPRGPVYFEYQKYQSLKGELGRWNINKDSVLFESKQNEALSALNTFVGTMRDTLIPLSPDSKWDSNSLFCQQELKELRNPISSCTEKSYRNSFNNASASKNNYSQNNNMSHGIKR